VDANVLIFERIKEELKRGLPKSSAIEEGFRRAWPSIRDSNTSTIITSIILYFFTSSFVQGFALTLGIGTLISLFSAITTTRLFLRFFLKDDAASTNKKAPSAATKIYYYHAQHCRTQENLVHNIHYIGWHCGACYRNVRISGERRTERRHTLGVQGAGDKPFPRAISKMNLSTHCTCRARK
jgi:multidrug efflux pump subunit AcrB